MRPPLSGHLLIVATAVLFSTGGVAIKACALGAGEVAGLRALIAAFTLLVLLRPPRAAFTPGALAIGACQAATMLLFVVANKHTTAAAAIFLQGTSLAWVALLSVVVLREPIRRGDLATLAVCAFGLALLVGRPDAPQTSAPDPVRGNLAGLASGVTWAFVITGLRWLATGADAASAAAGTVAANAGLALATAPWWIAAPVELGLRDALVLAWLGIFQVGLAYALLTAGVRRVRALEASLLLVAEPVLSTLWAWLGFGERPGTAGLAGCTLVLGATILTIRRDVRAGQRPTAQRWQLGQ